VQQRRRRAHLHVEQQPGVSLGRAFGIRSLHGHRTGFICRPSGHIETCLLAQVFPCAISISELLKFKHDQHKITKTSTLERERTLDIRRYLGRDSFGFLLFIFLIRLLRNVCVAFGSLRVCFACGEVMMFEAVACEWWQQY
jgi:hypothetical protein